MKVQFGSIITNGRGKVGGNYISRNHFGNFQGTATTPINPNSSYQSARRSAFLFLTANFKSLGAERIILWNDFAATIPKTDVFGNVYYSTGKNSYVSYNLNLFTIGQSYIDEPPTLEVVEPLPAISYIDVNAGAPYISIVFDSALSNTDQIVVLSGTPCISPGISNVRSKLRIFSVLPTPSGSSLDITTDYIAKFGTQLPGLKCFVQAQSIQVRTGQSGVPLLANTISY